MNGGRYPRVDGPGFTALRVPGTRDLLALHEIRPGRYPHLLESVARGGTGRFDILFAFPGHSLALAALDDFDFLSSLDQCWSQERLHAAYPALPFRGGWFLYLGYELAGQVEPVLRLPQQPQSLPMAMATRIPAAVICDHAAGETWLVAEQGEGELLEAIQDDLAHATAPQQHTLVSPRLIEEPAERFLEGVERIKRFIVEGDVFQVNLSRAWRGELAGDLTAHEIYRRLRRHNPGPFAGLASFSDGAVISSSPERLVSVTDGTVQTRPIAGTLPRRPGSDTAIAAELLGNPKERAEHVMLIDLERNDLGRVSVPGSVQVDELMVAETYAHVHHIVSNIRGRLRDEVTPGEVIRAVFPGGTITGCPKVRCMEIIAELEQQARGAYTGSMGYLNRNGDMDLNILIRTISLSGNMLNLRAGAGIVADSQPQRELEETRAKARGMLLALG